MTTPLKDSVLRLITAGSVDDGKSTLIGRILYDSQVLLSDQLEQIRNGNNKQPNAEHLDFASLTDGLAAEREQGITIDVAYRYFSTAERKFILADTPGHEQYTRNMITGASTADAAIILIDVNRLDFSQQKLELLPQTKRHSVLLKLLECPHLIVAVNKLDLINYDAQKFNQICTAYQELADNLAIKNVHYLPISALQGDNIINKSEHTPWYHGKSLIEILTQLDTITELNSHHNLAVHFPVQKVIRQDGSQIADFRAYQGRIEQGTLTVGQKVKILPAYQYSSIKEIYGVNGLVDSAKTGDVITVVLNDAIDISRGDAIVDFNYNITPTKQITATICWFDTQPLNPARKYWLKHTTTTVPAKIKQLNNVLDIKTLTTDNNRSTINMNDIGNVTISLQYPIIATEYIQNHATGSFILIDEITHQTVAAGMIKSIKY